MSMRTRLGFSVCAIEQSLYQSFGLGVFRLLGEDNLVYEHLLRHKVDEILLISPDIRTNEFDKGYDFSRLINRYIGIPACIGGSLTESALKELLEWGCVERVMFSGSIQCKNQSKINIVTQLYGRQAVVGCLALAVEENRVWILEENHRRYRHLSRSDIDRAFDLCDEVIFQDLGNYGKRNGFHYDEIVELTPYPNRTIINGGLLRTDLKRAMRDGLAAVYLDNLVMHSES